MKMVNKKYYNKKAQMSYLQILLLIVAVFAFCYIIYKTTEVKALDEEDYDKLKEEVKNALEGGYYQTEESYVQTLETNTEGYACCEKTKSGNYCQFVSGEECEEGFRTAPTECKYVNYCKEGCCFSQDSGWCNEATPKRSCDEAGGIWKEDKYCNIPECQRGCCVLGRNSIWTTERNCQLEAGFLGIEADFRSEISSEAKCIFLAEKDDKGACVFEDGCSFTTREQCQSMSGFFYKNIYCSDPGLDTGCERHDYKGCSENEIGNDQSVYWFDSCGNREEIAEACSIFAGTICGLEGNDYTCKSINCEVEINGRKVRKRNGESWCEYEGTIGDGRDVVGSRHVRHICFMGEERVEPCQDYRNEICVESEVEGFTEAACRINNWRSCINYNVEADKTTLPANMPNIAAVQIVGQQGTMAQKCQENPDCTVRSVNIDKFKFDMCVPEYPPGFDLTNEAGGRNAETICGVASQKCTVVYVKELFGGWECEVNCDCEKAVFAEQMNELCTSLGDCGAYVNTEGEISEEGYSVSGSPKLSSLYLNKLKSYARYKPGQKAEPGDLSFLGTLGLSQEQYEAQRDYADIAAGASGVALLLGVHGAGLTGISMTLDQIGIALKYPGSAAGSAASKLAFSNALATAGALLATQSLLVRGFGVDSKTAWIIAGIAVVVALVVLKLSFKLLGIYGLIIWGILELFGIGDTKEKIVEFKCLPWQPLSGGDSCDACNPEDELDVPCSKYRCDSLGQTCELINQGTEQQKCVDNKPDDLSSPKISPLLKTITEGYQYYNIQGTGFEILSADDSCIPEYTNVLFGIKTDKPAQCKISLSPLKIYDEIDEYFGGSNLYLTEHETILNIPSIEAFANQYALTPAQIEELGEIDFYVKCKSVNGVVNEAAYTIRSCVKPGPDLTAPYVTKISPINGAYTAYGATEQQISLWVNEPANCRWSFADNDYTDMENKMQCQTSLGSYELYGWPCSTTLSLESNKFYIKCKDTSENNNTMSTSYVYELKPSSSELRIIDISPNGTIVSGVEPVTITLTAATSGGVDGTAKCSFSFGDSYIEFFETNSKTHSQVFSTITRGTYNIDIRCVDVAGNIAESSTSFKVDIDTEAPIITRAYYDAGLTIITNEPATCAYSVIDCNFDIENATAMSSTEKEHNADWDTEQTYYIRCQDEYGNQPGKCSIIIRPYDVI